MAISVLLCTAPVDAADALAESLLKTRRCACVNIVGPVRSRYWWNGQIESAEEALLVVKTPSAHVSALTEDLVALHPYDVPEVLAVPVESGFEAYLAWVRREASGRP